MSELQEIQQQQHEEHQQVQQLHGSGTEEEQFDLNVIDGVEKSSLPATGYYRMLSYMALIIGGWAGFYARVGFSYYRVWNVDVVNETIFGQIIGCLIFGFIVAHRDYFESGTTVRKLWYIALTTGFCGTLTSFAPWNYECNKHFFLQWDVSWGNAMGSYNGARFFDWIICMWGGILLPASAFSIGMFLAYSFSKRSNGRIPKPTVSASNAIPWKAGELLWCLFFLITLLLGFAAPGATTWFQLSLAVFFLLFALPLRSYLINSKLNLANPDFPFGTLVCNVVGCWLFAAFMAGAKFNTVYADHRQLATFYGMTHGFSAALTAFPTLITELEAMKRPGLKYRYGIATYLFCQLGFIFLLDITSFKHVPVTDVSPPPVDFCHTYLSMCNNLMVSIDCPSNMQMISSCTKMPSKKLSIGDAVAHGFNTTCQCGNFYASERITELIIDSQLRQNVTNSLVPVYPTSASVYATNASVATEAIDFCLSYVNLCDHFLNRIQCPYDHRKIQGCGLRNDGSISEFIGSCACGLLNDTPSAHVSEILIDQLLFRMRDMIPYTMYPTTKYVPINLCSAYYSTCQLLMEKIQCPSAHRRMQPCVNSTVTPNYATFGFMCQCKSRRGVLGADERVGEDIIDALLKKEMIYANMVVPNTAMPGHFDVCTSYQIGCGRILDQIGCPAQYRYNPSPCTNSTSGIGSVSQWIEMSDWSPTIVNTCACQNVTFISEWVREAIIDGILANTYKQIQYFAPPVAPYTMVAMFNPFRPLMQPMYPPPIRN